MNTGDSRGTESQLCFLKSENKRLQDEIKSIKKAHEFELLRCKKDADRYRQMYERLISEHDKVVKLNSELEGRILATVESLESERVEFTNQVTNLREQVASSEETIKRLSAACESYKNDCKVATELLHADPSQFLPINPQDSASPSHHRSRRPKHTSTSSEDNLLSAPTAPHYLLPTTFPPIGIYTTDNSVPTTAERTAPSQPPETKTVKEGPVLEV